MGNVYAKNEQFQLKRSKKRSWTCLSKHIIIALGESLRKRIYSEGAESRGLEL